jgi:hypothetical protein
MLPQPIERQVFAFEERRDNLVISQARWSNGDGCHCRPFGATGAQHGMSLTCAAAGMQHPVCFSSRSASFRSDSTCPSTCVVASLNSRDDRIGGLREPVIDPKPFASRCDEADATQVCQMSRRLGLRNLQRVVNIADAQLACHQQSQDAEPCGVGERLEQFLELVQLIHIFALTNISAPIQRCQIFA